MATKKVETFDLQLVTYSTPLPPDVVIARLDAEVVKDKCPGKEFGASDGFKTKEEVEAALTAGIGPSGLIYFTEFDHGKWLPFYQNPPFSKPPRKVLFYHIGNPIIAETMIRHDIRASHNLPPRILIVEKEDGTGTDVHFHLPSSVIYLNRPHAEMKAATDRLDRIFEGIGERITAV